MGYIGTFDGKIFHNPSNKFCVIVVKTADASVPVQARDKRRYKDNLIRFTAVGYEIPFTKTFYEYKELEPADEIAKRIEAHERSLMEKLRMLFGKVDEE